MRIEWNSTVTDLKFVWPKFTVANAQLPEAHRIEISARVLRKKEPSYAKNLGLSN